MDKFIIETSARHVHVCEETLEKLFGKGATLTNKKDLSQPGQFACEEKALHVLPTKLNFLQQTPVLSALKALSVNQAILQAHRVANW